MKPKWFAFAASIVAGVLLSGCTLQDMLPAWLSVEGRINAVFPPAPAVVNNRDWLLAATAGAKKNEIESQLKYRLRLRALNCAKAYAPSFLSSAESIRKKLGGSSCFVEADQELAKWTGLLRAGILLADGPLKPASKAAPALVTAEAPISAVQFARDAPVALLNLGRMIQVIDLQTSKPLLRELAGSSVIGQLSNNGRLFTTADAQRSTRIRDSETGEVLVDLPYAGNFHWLDANTAAFNEGRSGREAVVLIDFTHGAEIAVPALDSRMERAAAVPGTDSEYVIFSGRGVTKVVLDRAGLEPSVTVAADKKINRSSWTLHNADATADGTHYFGAAGLLNIVNLATLESDEVQIEPFRVQLAYTSPDPDKVLIRGVASQLQGLAGRMFLYSISKRTLLPVDTAKLPSERVVYIPFLRKLGAISDRKIEILGDLPTLDEISLAKFTSDMLDSSNQLKIAALEMPQLHPTNLPLLAAARGAQVEAVGVYQGAGAIASGSGNRKSGAVQVRIRRSAKPIVLVLSSYEPVRWTLVPESGARLAAVLVSSYYQSQVVGAGTVRVLATGTQYAYKQDSAEFQKLNREVAQSTGMPISVFQGRYEGSQFSVGGF